MIRIDDRTAQGNSESEKWFLPVYAMCRTLGYARKDFSHPMADRMNTRIDTTLKKKALNVFDRLGLSEAEAIRLFYAQVELHQGIPFPVKVPNAATLAACEESKNPEKLPSFKNFRALRDRAGT
jgi:DNA-damage-inducible protein J